MEIVYELFITCFSDNLFSAFLLLAKADRIDFESIKPITSLCKLTEPLFRLRRRLISVRKVKIKKTVQYVTIQLLKNINGNTYALKTPHKTST